ncbi:MULTISPECIES: ABC transporter permease [Streptomycetaceae]|uniref:ABC-2 type transporter n=1 Tax=Streptantibioticus cattleyicolor (strain ATCC 35852 / DSM 46488 / JCM 4925 / NBRC 14057 / NRRL 8057) TaxID=1003195 RepID=F8K3M2_STREN|nr:MULTISPECIES: ABC transporter permease [Streptomycetaceae]AEW96342.1 ABC-2 type transporter [Streptantibioticus cattleyicolor NRRL 8057 = DSM 46488]MYS60857.1 ABC transporter permease [Streptomyces sp. SID5468]CCB76682.1 putative ABC transporter permease protein [Streptantibioticus cattleyicolor NRRL 8057 = DSM 46488]
MNTLASRSLIKLEITRTLRNKRFMFFSVIYPAGLFLLISGSAGSQKIGDTGLSMQLYFMVSMASFGVLTAVLMGNSERISKEREKGWVRQLRLTALPGHGYVLAKIASAATVTLPAIVVVELVAAIFKGVRLEAWQWIALSVAIWAGSLVFAALGVAIGYLVNGDAVRPVTMLIYFGLSILGGLWMPATVFPQWLQNIAKWLPTSAYAALGHAIEAGGAPHARDLAVLVGYLVVFGGGAAWLYRKDSLKA